MIETHAVLRGARPRDDHRDLRPHRLLLERPERRDVARRRLAADLEDAIAGLHPGALGGTARPERPHDPGSIGECSGRSSCRSASPCDSPEPVGRTRPRARASSSRRRRSTASHRASTSFPARPAMMPARRRIRDVREVAVERDGPERSALQPVEHRRGLGGPGAESPFHADDGSIARKAVRRCPFLVEIEPAAVARVDLERRRRALDGAVDDDLAPQDAERNRARLDALREQAVSAAPQHHFGSLVIYTYYRRRRRTSSRGSARVACRRTRRAPGSGRSRWGRARRGARRDRWPGARRSRAEASASRRSPSASIEGWNSVPAGVVASTVVAPAPESRNAIASRPPIFARTSSSLPR